MNFLKRVLVLVSALNSNIMYYLYIQLKIFGRDDEQEF